MYRKNKFKSFSLCLEVLTCFFLLFYVIFTYQLRILFQLKILFIPTNWSCLYRTVMEFLEQTFQWYKWENGRRCDCHLVSPISKEFHHVEKGKMHHVNGRTGIITTVTNAKLHVMLSHHEDYICSSETGDMWNLPASGLNRSVKNVIRWLENSRCESGLVHEVFNWGGQAPSWMTPCGSPSLLSLWRWVGCTRTAIPYLWKEEKLPGQPQTSKPGLSCIQSFGKTQICHTNSLLIRHLIWYHFESNENMGG